TAAMVAIEVVAGIAGLPVDRIELGIIGAGEPGNGTRMIEVAPLPRLRVRLSLFRGVPEAPDFLAGGLIEGGDKSARALVPTGRARDYKIADSQRRRGRVVILMPVGHLGLPQQLARETLQRDDVCVIGDHEDAVARQGHTAIDPAGCVADQAARAGPLVVPDL